MGSQHHDRRSCGLPGRRGRSHPLPAAAPGLEPGNGSDKLGRGLSTKPALPNGSALISGGENANNMVWDNYFPFQRDRAIWLRVFVMSSNCPELLYLERALIPNYIPLAPRITRQLLWRISRAQFCQSPRYRSHRSTGLVLCGRVFGRNYLKPVIEPADAQSRFPSFTGLRPKPEGKFTAKAHQLVGLSNLIFLKRR